SPSNHRLPPPPPLFVQVGTGPYTIGQDRLTQMGLRALDRQPRPAGSDEPDICVSRAGARATDGEAEERALHEVLLWEDLEEQERIRTVYLGRVDEYVKWWTRQEEKKMDKRSSVGTGCGSEEKDDRNKPIGAGEKRTRK
ncbi:hypothetical protein HDU87_003596, partial [Geranomyces variabilis]